MAERELLGVGEPKPEADAIEQTQPALLDEGADQLPDGAFAADVPEADALDQARVVPVPPDDEIR